MFREFELPFVPFVFGVFFALVLAMSVLVELDGFSSPQPAELTEFDAPAPEVNPFGPLERLATR